MGANRIVPEPTTVECRSRPSLAGSRLELARLGQTMPDILSDHASGGLWSALPCCERRSDPRYRFIATAVVTELSPGTRLHRLSVRTFELGLNGCYIDTIEPFLVGTFIHLRILKGNVAFETPGRVVYRHRGIGMGVVFIDSTANQQIILQGWLAELAARSQPTS